MIKNVLALITFLSLNGHNSTPLSSQKLSVAPLESSRRDAHNSKNNILRRSDTRQLSFGIIFKKELEFRSHQCSKATNALILDQNWIRVISNVSEWLVMISWLSNDTPTSKSFCNLAKGHECHPNMRKTLLITWWGYIHIYIYIYVYMHIYTHICTYI